MCSLVKYLKMLTVLICVVLLTNCVESVDVRVDPLVLINQGLVRGRRATDGSYSTFLGIPYAEVDENNPFGKSLPSPIFEEVIFNAYDGSSKCPQSEPFESGGDTLNCLKLNIHVPFHASSSNPLPVLVFFHGGSFSSGSAGEYGVGNLVRHGIIVVTANYRLGPYGFMCLNVPAVPGNQGLKDQYAALLWIKKNIAAFGGNPYNVTLSGQDAGACSALLHLYSDKSKLFHKVIVESGTPQNEGMFVNGDEDAAIKLAGNIGLNTSDTEEALEFLAKTPHNLVTAAASNLNLVLKPCRERSFSGVENFVESDPFVLSNRVKVSNTPILIGHTYKEETMDVLDYETDPFYEKIANNFNLNQQQLKTVARQIKHFYIGDEPVSKDVVSKLDDFESDFVFNHPTQRQITKLLEENATPLYEYVFSYVGDSSAEAAGHSAELCYLFGMVNSKALTADDQLIIDRITTLWSNFVKYGNPTPSTTDLLPVIWTPVTEDTRPYLVIDTNMRMESRVFNERMAFWDLFYSNFASYNKLSQKCQI